MLMLAYLYNWRAAAAPGFFVIVVCFSRWLKFCLAPTYWSILLRDKWPSAIQVLEAHKPLSHIKVLTHRVETLHDKSCTNFQEEALSLFFFDEIPPSCFVFYCNMIFHLRNSDNWRQLCLSLLLITNKQQKQDERKTIQNLILITLPRVRTLKNWK